ncbi:MAG: type II toxin-antitoxin system RelE/ParE family toxin [Rickettsiales bacterium]|jgi:plasmid stabilization system protein ParE|nr:type II toxin-antitoxin system RelE/ParE family toxin [Rickettsiales bacterium]
MKSYKLHLSDEFRQNLQAIHDYISKDSPNTAAAVYLEIKTAALALADMPESKQKVPEMQFADDLQNKNFRQAICKNHRIIYKIEGDTVDIVSVRNCRRDALVPTFFY